MKLNKIRPALVLTACLALPFAASAKEARHPIKAAHPSNTVLGVSKTIHATAAQGWSVKKTILDKSVYNDDAHPEVVGEVEDIVITPKGSVSYIVINASKYLGLSSHYVLIPAEQLSIKDNRITLPGATKEALRKVPEFKYASDVDKVLK